MSTSTAKAPALTQTKSGTGQSGKQGSSQSKSGGSNFGQKVEPKPNSPKK